MTIFFDHLRINTDKNICPSDIICHLCTDGNISELHKFASNILGIKDKQWFDNRPDRQHYDIDINESIIALRNGAIQKLFHKTDDGKILFFDELDQDILNEDVEKNIKRVINFKRNLLFHKFYINILKPGDKIGVHEGFYHSTKLRKITAIGKHSIYADLEYGIYQFSKYNGILHKNCENQRVYTMYNFDVAHDRNTPNLSLPIFNSVKLKQKISRKDIPKNYKCFDFKEKNVCLFLNYSQGYLHCEYLKDTLFEDYISSTDLNSCRCRTEKPNR